MSPAPPTFCHSQMSCEATVRQTMTYLHRYKQLKSYVLPGTLCLNIPAYLSQCFLDIDNVYERICLHLQCEIHRSEIDYLLPSVFPPSHSSHSRALYLKATWWSHLAQDSQHQQSKNGSLSLFSTFSLSLSISCALRNKHHTHRLRGYTDNTLLSPPQCAFVQ